MNKSGHVSTHCATTEEPLVLDWEEHLVGDKKERFVTNMRGVMVHAQCLLEL